MTPPRDWLGSLRRLMHLAHQHQVLLAVIVAAIVLTAAWFMPGRPLTDPRTPRVAVGGETSGARGVANAEGVRRLRGQA